MKRLYYVIKILMHGRSTNLIKIISLSLGLLMSVFLFSRIAYELSYDNFWHEAENLYFVKSAWGNNEMSSFTSHAIPGTIAEEFPEEVESATTCCYDDGRYRLGEKTEMFSTVMADTLYFSTLGLSVIEGNSQELANPDVIFLSSSSAHTFFGDESPLGKTLTWCLWEKEVPVLVKGVFADVPVNTAMRSRPEAVISMPSLKVHTARTLGWNSSGDFQGYLRLRSSADADALNERLTDAIVSKSGKEVRLEISPICGLHRSAPEVQTMMGIMVLLGVVLLFTTTLNYVLVSIASLAQRAKGIGVHKCNGASGCGILSMFLMETAVVIGLALLLIGLLVYLFGEGMEVLLGVPLNLLFAWENLWAPIAVIVLLFLIGGCLPGVLFSRIPVTQVFQRYTSGRRGWKRMLLFVQFGSAAFILGMLLLVFAQYHYAVGRDRGYRPERVVATFQQPKNPEYLCSLLVGLPYVESVASAGNILTGLTSPHKVKDNQGNQLFIPRSTDFDKNFLPFIGLRLAAGHNLTGDGQLLVNRKFVQSMKWLGSGVGERVNDFGTVVGVLDTLSFAHSSADDAAPVMITWSNGIAHCIHARLKEPFDENLVRLNEEMDKVYPQNELHFFSLEMSIKDASKSVYHFLCVTLLVAITILFIILMGLIGYLNDEIRLRSKEIAIRKVNGAEAGNVLRLLYRDVLLLAFPAVIVGTIGAFKAGEVWVSQFVDAVRMPVVGYMAVVIGLLLFIVVCIVIKAWRIANENPVKSIKNE